MTTAANAPAQPAPAGRPGPASLDEFARGGFARLAHFQSPEWARHKDELERASATFSANAWRDGPGGYFWPLDPLHWWSRIWEYPFFAAHLERLSGGNGTPQPGRRPRLLDIGAAVTFFTPYLISKGYDVLSVDYDPAMPAYFAKAYAAVAPSMGLSSTIPPYVVADARDARLPDAGFDLITCVSVLEHIPQWERVLEEMKRMLKPGGHLVLTLDVKLNETSSGFTLEELSRLLDQLSADLELLTSGERSLPPDVLDMNNSPYAASAKPGPGRSLSGRLWPPTALPGKVVRAIRRRLRPTPPRPPENLCVFGGVWRKASL